MSKDAKPKGNTLNDALAENDPDTVCRNKIDKVLAGMLEEGAERWEYEGAFAKRTTDLTEGALRGYRFIYRKHVAISPRMGERREKVLWFASPAVAQKFREKSGAKEPQQS